MSTTYELAIGGPVNRATELCMVEQSSTLAIMMSVTGEGTFSIHDLTPEQVRDMALRMILVASYSAEDPEEFMEESAGMFDYDVMTQIGVVETNG